jgi:hypothetical protein
VSKSSDEMERKYNENLLIAAKKVFLPSTKENPPRCRKFTCGTDNPRGGAGSVKKSIKNGLVAWDKSAALVFM